MPRITYALPLSAALLAAAWPTAADACGGTFCDNIPGAMPVDQTGENILFILEPNKVEVHIQIQYDPDTNAQKFAWMVPMPTVPEFDVGSELLFRELLRATVPTYGLNTTNESCGGDSDGGIGSTSGDTGPILFDLPAETGGGVDVVKIETVGAFEVVVLAGKSAPELTQWLVDNGYQTDPEAEPILQQYLDEGNVVIALKLLNGQDLNSIHPIVLRYPGLDGCVPIRLTRIAAVEDMEIRVFALADGRAIPTNYRHVLVNPLKLDWLSFASNYKEVITLAVDAFMAEGRAFVTEFAGTSSVVNQFAFYSPGWNAEVFAGMAPAGVIDELNSQGLTDCYDSFFCQFNHPLLEGLLATYLPPPMGVTPAEFYSALADYAGQIDVMAWGDGGGFAKDMLTRVVLPAEHAKTLLDTWPYLSRLYTTISPAEMTEDPFFMFNPQLPDVANLQIASQYVRCDGYSTVTLPDGREVNLSPNSSWPTFQTEMPWEEDVEQMPPMGMPQPLVDNTALINALLAEWNKQHKPPPPPTTTGDPTTGGPTGGEPTGGTDSATGAASASASGDPGGDSSPAIWGGTEGGCGCASDPRPGSGLVALLGLLALLPRRRARA